MSIFMLGYLIGIGLVTLAALLFDKHPEWLKKLKREPEPDPWKPYMPSDNGVDYTYYGPNTEREIVEDFYKLLREVTGANEARHGFGEKKVPE